MSSHSPLPRKIDNVIHQITDLREYAEKDYKTGSEASSLVCPFEGFKSMGIKALKTQEVC